MTPLYNIVYAETVLGSPRARCARFGICQTRAMSPKTWAAFLPTSARTVKTRIWVDENQQLCFVFQASSVSPIAREYFFATPFFKVDVAKKLPAKICKMLGIESFVIQPGLYEWQVQADGDWVVCFGAQKMEYESEGSKLTLPLCF
ncbi:MAG: hypothetical protein WCR52_04825 [Bacteroidota bacterium]